VKLRLLLPIHLGLRRLLRREVGVLGPFWRSSRGRFEGSRVMMVEERCFDEREGKENGYHDRRTKWPYVLGDWRRYISYHCYQYLGERSRQSNSSFRPFAPFSRISSAHVLGDQRREVGSTMATSQDLRIECLGCGCSSRQLSERIRLQGMNFPFAGKYLRRQSVKREDITLRLSERWENLVSLFRYSSCCSSLSIIILCQTKYTFPNTSPLSNVTTQCHHATIRNSNARYFF
jgi:hypothetical protein